ncbi:MAG: SDR family oxidoreductase [Gammaproteobacteria bacterium]|nr:SDR family oxidoreductase [Gammaproteobacteria bacterium]
MTTVSGRGVDLVFGASGYIGSNLVPFLLAEGRRVRATSRHVEVLEGRGWSPAELLEADALDPGSLDVALQNVDTAYYLVHSMAAGENFPELDAMAAGNFAAAAARQQVRRIVYLGGLIPDAPQSRHLRSRRETGDTLRQGSVPVIEIRAGMIIGPGSAAWEVIRDLVNHLPLMITPRWVLSRSTPIALGNLLRYLAEAPRHPQTAGETYDVGGPEVLTYIDIMRQYGRLVGKHPFIIQVPVLTPRLSSYWLRLVTSVPTNIARALIDGLSQDVIASDTRLAELVPQKLLDFRAAARAALDADRQHAVPARWVEGSIACRDFRPDYAFYAKRAGARALTSASRNDLWNVILTVGENGDFFYARWLWWLRRVVDWLVGGPSLRRRRRHPRELRIGDVVDSWRVIAIEPGKSLTLLMEMKAVGSGVLEFAVADADDKRAISADAYWHPAGVWGLLYWYTLLPFHGYLFRGTTRAIARRAEDRRPALNPTH